MTDRITEVFVELVALAERLGISRVNELPGCWEYQIDDEWSIAVNGHREPVECSAGVMVQPFSAYVQWRGWPAGVIDPVGGMIVAHANANEDGLIAAIKRCAT